MTDPLARLREAAAVRSFRGLARQLNPRYPGGDGLIDFASNDYLGLTRDKRVLSAAAAATLVWGAGSTGSRLVTGTTSLHTELEHDLAGFMRAPAALVFSSGYLANLGVLSALTGPEVLIVSDKSNHASIIDGCRLSQARVVVVPHRDLPAMERALALRSEPDALLVTDAVFSVGGDLAPLADIHKVTRRYGALLAVDEAHSLGVIGEGGRGAVHAAGLGGERDVIRTVTLSKSLGSQGGAVIADPEVIGTLIDTARPFIFDTGLAPAATAGALAALRVLAGSPDLAVQVRARAGELAWLARQAGLTASRPDAAVLSITLGDPQSAVRAQQVAADNGIRVGCFRPPSVPQDWSCLRLTARADLTEGQLSSAARAFHAVARAHGATALR